MSILINGMERPKSCEDCPLENCDENYYGDESNHRCPLIYKGYTSNNRYEKRRDDCPLVPVPPHGRLIDANALLNAIKKAWEDDSEIADVYEVDYAVVSGWIYTAPTVIPADKDGEA